MRGLCADSHSTHPGCSCPAELSGQVIRRARERRSNNGDRHELMPEGTGGRYVKTLLDHTSRPTVPGKFDVSQAFDTGSPWHDLPVA